MSTSLKPSCNALRAESITSGKQGSLVLVPADAELDSRCSSESANTACSKQTTYHLGWSPTTRFWKLAAVKAVKATHLLLATLTHGLATAVSTCSTVKPIATGTA
jgi:hypothetical protein